MHKLATRTKEKSCQAPGCGKPCWKILCSKCASQARQGRIEIDPSWGIQPNQPCKVSGCPYLRVSKVSDYCRAHYEFDLHGKAPESKRTKRRNHEAPPACSECEQPAVSRGLCRTHYSAARHARSVTPRCVVAECEKRATTGDNCAHHAKQIAKYGFSWIGDKPVDRIYEWREAQKPFCRIDHCDRRATSLNAPLCKTHASDRRRKKCSMEFYVELLEKSSCEACGSPDFLVTDHDHSHHGDMTTMCQECIRGRLCNGCNTALGYLNESQERILHLARYLETHCGVPRPQ